MDLLKRPFNKVMVPLFIFIFSFHCLLKAETIYEAENALEIYHGVIENEHEGYSGTGYVNGDNETGSYLRWGVNIASEGEQVISVFYANGSDQDRNMDVILNGDVVLEDVSFPATDAWTSWATQNFTINLEAGLNQLKLKSTTNDGPPNIDRINVTGEPGDPYYMLDMNVLGEGEVSVSPDKELYEAGTEVRLSAEATVGYSFAAWEGYHSGKESNITVKMDSTLAFSAVFIRDGLVVKTNRLTGWASCEGKTTGGMGGDTVYVSTQSELENYIGSSEPYIIYIEGTIYVVPKGKEMDVGSNTTLIGKGDDAILQGGGLGIKGVENVIVKNITIRDAFVTYDGKTTDFDAIEINDARHVWIDHCNLTHFDDGLIDIKNKADYVTVSWCHFYDHNKVILIGSVDDDTYNRGHLNVTVHHCWFDGRYGIGLQQRLPLVRFGKVHMFNNYYLDIGTRGVEVRTEGNVYIENNYFENVEMPIALPNVEGLDHIANRDSNIFVNSGNRRDSKGNAFDPSEYYEYTSHNVADVPLIVMLGAGVGKDTLIGDPDSEFPDTTTSIRFNEPTGSEVFSLGSLYPNPFSDKIMISFDLQKSMYIQLEIWDVTGRMVTRLYEGYCEAGKHQFPFYAGNLPAGIYVCKMSAAQKVLTRKMIIKE